MATPADNVSDCAKTLSLLSSTMDKFSGQIDKLIDAVKNIKIGTGKGGGRSGGGGADADAIDVAKINSTQRLAEAKAVADLEFSKAKAFHEYELKAAKLRSQRNGKLDESVYQKELLLVEVNSRSRYYAAKKAADISIRGAEQLNSTELYNAGATVKTARNFENKANSQEIANMKNLQSINQSHAIKSSHIELALDDQISQAAIAQNKKVEAAKLKAKAAADKASMSQIEEDKKYAIDAAKLVGDEALKNAKIAGDAAFAEAGRVARATLANAKLSAKMSTTLDARQRESMINSAKDASDAAFDGAKVAADAALDGATKAAEAALRGASASRKEMLDLDRKIFNASVSDNASLTQSKLASEEAVNNARRNLNTQIEKEEIAKQKKIADAAKKRSGGSGGGQKNKSMDFTGAKSFDPKEFLNSLKGGLVSGVANATTQGFSVFQKTRQNVSNATGGKGAPGGGIASTMAGPVAAIGAIVGVVGALTTAFMALIEMVGKFVGALDPALMQQLGLAFENLSAVIGIGLRPIVSAVVLVIKAFGDTLVPVMKQLEPVMIKLSMALLNAVIPFLLIWGYELELLIPVIEALIPTVVALGDVIMLCVKLLIPPLQILSGALLVVISIFNLVVSAVYLLLAAFYAASGELKSWVPGKGKAAEADKSMAASMEKRSLDAARESVQGGAKGMGLMLEGAKGYIPGSGDPNKRERAKPGGAEGAAAKGASYSGVADLGKNMMQAAFGSSSQNVENQQLAQQKQMNAGIDRIGGFLFGWERPREAAAGVRN